MTVVVWEHDGLSVLRRIIGRVGARVSRTALIRTAWAASIVAAMTHALAVPSHLEEWWGYGTFFIVAASGQLAFALVVARRATTWTLIAGAAGTSGSIGLWLLSRTAGVPVGPEAGHVEAVGLLDAVSKTAEALVLIALIGLVRLGGARRLHTVAIVVPCALLLAAAPFVPAHAHEDVAAGHLDQAMDPGGMPDVDVMAGMDEEFMEHEAEPWVEPDCTPSGSAVPAFGGPAAGTARVIARPELDGIFVYDPATDRDHKLVTFAGEPCWVDAVALRGERALSFALGGVVYDVDFDTGTLDRLFSSGAMWVGSMAWSPDGSALAYVIHDERSHPILRIYSRAQGSWSTLREIASPVYGGCGGPGDEDYLAWSEDGTKLVMVVPGIETGETIYVMNASGNDVVTAMRGAYGRLMPGGDALLYRDWEWPQPAWHIVELSTGSSRKLGVKNGTYRPAIARGGKSIVFDDGQATLWAYDVDSNTERRLASNGMSPVWLNAGTVAATDAKPCPDCDHEGWTSKDSAFAIELDGSDRRPLLLASTMRSVVAYTTDEPITSEQEPTAGPSEEPDEPTDDEPGRRPLTGLPEKLRRQLAELRWVDDEVPWPERSYRRAG